MRQEQQTPLLLAMGKHWFKLIRTLLDNGADANAENNDGKTPLPMLSEHWWLHSEDDVLCTARSLLEHGAEVDKRDKPNQTPLLLAMVRGRFKLAQIFLEHGANANIESKDGKTPLDLLAKDHRHNEAHDYNETDFLNLALLLLDHGAELIRRDKDKQTPLLFALGRDWFKLAQILSERGADANGENCNGETSLHLLSNSRVHSESDALDLIQLSLEHGASVNKRDEYNRSPLLLVMGRNWLFFFWRNWFELARILLEHGADANAENDVGKTPLHILSECQIFDSSDLGFINSHLGLYSEHGAEVNRKYKGNETPLLLEIGTRMHKLA